MEDKTEKENKAHTPSLLQCSFPQQTLTLIATEEEMPRLQLQADLGHQQNRCQPNHRRNMARGAGARRGFPRYVNRRLPATRRTTDGRLGAGGWH